MTLRVWSEFLPYDEACQPATLQLLARYHLCPHFAVHPDSDLDALGALIHACDTLGIEAWIWPLLSPSQGYWANESNSGAWLTRVDEILRALAKSGVKPFGVAVDLEPPLSRVAPLTRKFSVIRTTVQWLEHIDPTQYQASLAQWNIVAATLRAWEIRTLAITTPAAAHDIRDGKPVWQDLLQTPWSGVNWDVKGIMAYNSMVAGYSRGLLNIEDARALHTPLLQRVASRFEDRGHASLGLTGTGVLGNETTYTHPNQLRDDVAAARYAGLTDLGLFCLEGVLAATPEAWLDAFAHPGAAPPRKTWKTNVIRHAARGARRIAKAVQALEVLLRFPY